MAGQPRFPLVARAVAPVLGVLTTALLIALSQRPFRAFDTYFHLRIGEEFRHHWSIAHPGHLSPASTNDWVPTQWLPQIVLSWLDDEWGISGLAVAFAALVSALVAATYLLLRRRGSAGPAAVLTLVVVIGCLPSLSLRPQILSYLFFAVVLATWEGARRDGRPPWLLVPLTWVWAMCHGMWILGICGSAVLAIAVVVERRPPRRTAIGLLVVPAAMLAAALATPVGPRLLDAVVLVNSRADYFYEWRAPELATIGAAPVTLLLVAAVLLLVRRDGVEAYDIGLLMVGGALALYSNRTLPVALITLALLVAGEWSRRDRRPPVGRAERLGVAVLAVAVIVIAPLGSAPSGEAEDLRPFAADLDAIPDGGTVLTDWVAGSVLLRTHPHLDIPFHGYGDMFTDDELAANRSLMRLEPRWPDTLAALHPRAALLPTDAPLTAALEDDGWTVRRQRNGLALLLPPGRVT